MANIIYIPWDGALATEFLAKSQQWVDTQSEQKHTRNWIIVKYKDPGLPLSNIPFGSTIYVRGHGESGKHSIQAVHSGWGDIGYDLVCDRMIADGLGRSFVGTIKFSCCNSGVPKLGSQPFAAKASQYLRLKGYLFISFVGYLGAIDGRYDYDNGDAHRHRYVNVLGTEVKSKWVQVRF